MQKNAGSPGETGEKMWALITGASSGIGLELARLIAGDGYSLVITARRSDRLEELAAELQGRHGVEVLPLQADLSRPGSAEELHRQLFDRRILPSILVNNAGFGELGSFYETDPKRISSMVQLNCTSLTELTRCFLPEMVARGTGRVLNLSSVAAFQPGPFMATYYATKAYVQSLSEALAEELHGTGVTVTALCPGPTASEFQQEAKMDTAKYFSRGRIPTAREVAEYGYRSMLRGKRVAVNSLSYRLLLFVSRFLPRLLVVKSVRRLQETR